MRIQERLNVILAKMPEVGKWQRTFFHELFRVLFALRGRVNFVNLSRYSVLGEQTFRRQFGQFFDWLGFNLLLLSVLGLKLDRQVIGALDASYLPKAGKHTYGLDRFWSGVAGRAKQGLELSLLALIDPSSGRAWSLYAEQTPSGLATNEADASSLTRTDYYLMHWRSCLSRIKEVVYFVADGFYAKAKVFDAFAQEGKHLITKLRADANLRYLYQGKQANGRGRTKQYDGKVNPQDLSRWHDLGPDFKYPHLHLYHQRLNSPSLKRNLRVVLLLNTRTQKYILLACSQVDLDPRTIVLFYQLRFQIEFLFRDAKQFTGLAHCQAREANKLHFHFNMSLAAINLVRMEQSQQDSAACLNNFTRRAYNEAFLQWIFSQLTDEADFHLNPDTLETIIQYGTMTKPRSQS